MATNADRLEAAPARASDTAAQAAADTARESADASYDEGAAANRPAGELGDAPIPGEGAWLDAAKRYNKGRRYTKDQWMSVQSTVQTGSDGVPGANTARAVYRWQTANGLDADGKVGPNTFSAITAGGGGGAATTGKDPAATDEAAASAEDAAASAPSGGQTAAPAGAGGEAPIGAKVVPSGEPAKYEFYRSVILAEGGTFSDKAKDINLMGVRGLSDGVRVANVKNAYNDTIVVLWKDPDGNPHAEEFKGTVDPGSFEKYYNKNGDANLMDGQYKYKVGTHKGYQALNQAEEVDIWRDKNKDGARESSDVQEKGWYGINIHAGGTTERVGGWSAGCQVIWGGRGPGTPFNKFMELVLKDPDQQFEYTLTDVSKLPYSG